MSRPLKMQKPLNEPLEVKVGTKITFVVPLYDGKIKIIKGFAAGRYLAINRHIVWSSSGYWIISHVPTGCRVVAVYGSKQKVLKIAGEMERFGDWDFTTVWKKSSRSKRAQTLRALVDKFEGQYGFGRS